MSSKFEEVTRISFNHRNSNNLDAPTATELDFAVNNDDKKPNDGDVSGSDYLKRIVRHGEGPASALPQDELKCLMTFPMHTVPIQDLLQWDRMHPHHEVKEMGNFVVLDPQKEPIKKTLKKRKVIFVSHQWVGYKEPDPDGIQFDALRGALNNLLAGEVIHPADSAKQLPGVPKPTRFDKMLRDALVWIDYYSIPQATTEQESKDMLKAIASLPAYVQEASLMLILAPVVPRPDQNEDCDFPSWLARGWCRLEVAASFLVPRIDCTQILVEGPDTMRLMCADWFAYRESVGHGNFSCCDLGHKIDIGGQVCSIPCDRIQVSLVLSKLYWDRCEALHQKPDKSEYRFLRAHEHVVLGGLPCLEKKKKLDSWEEFADEFCIDRDKPLEAVSGFYPWCPLAFATISLNVAMVKYLLSLGADPNEILTEKANLRKKVDKAVSLYAGQPVFNLLMKLGRGTDEGHQVFRLFAEAGANMDMERKAAKHKHGLRLLSYGVYAHATDMVELYMEYVPNPPYLAIIDRFGCRQEQFPVMMGDEKITKKMIEHGCKFQSRNDFGMGTLAIFAMCIKEVQTFINVKTLDLVLEAGHIPDINAQIFDFESPADPPMRHQKMKFILNVMYWFCSRGFFKKNKSLQSIYKTIGGTVLHGAVSFDKPVLVEWLVAKGADTSRKTRRGQTALELSEELGYGRCTSVLRRETKAVQRYSIFSVTS
eukprot:gene589-1008_t